MLAQLCLSPAAARPQTQYGLPEGHTLPDTIDELIEEAGWTLSRKGHKVDPDKVRLGCKLVQLWS
jgi:hypothetical protein